MTLRIAYILEATAGGTRKHLVELVLGVRAQGHEVLVIVSPGRDPDFGDDIASYAQKGCTVNVVPMRREICPFSDAAALFHIVKHLKRFKPDVIHTHAAKAGALGRIASLFLPKVAVIHTPHTLPFEWAEGWRRLVYRLLEAAFGRLSDTIVALTNAQATTITSARMLKLGRAPAVIPNGVSRTAGLPREEIRRRWGAGTKEVVVAQVARLAPQKACSVFVKAASQVDAPSIRFFLMGDGPLRERLEGEARTLGLSPERFHFIGHVPHAERCYAGIDILVLTSLYEGLPYVVLEAMAAGLPVIAPKIPGMDEVVADGKTGILVPVGDVSAAALTIARLASDKKLRETLGRNGSIQVERCFTAEAFTENHLSLYRMLAST